MDEALIIKGPNISKEETIPFGTITHDTGDIASL